jgi:hypothetical protein
MKGPLLAFLVPTLCISLQSCTNAESVERELAGKWSQQPGSNTPPVIAALDLRWDGTFVARNLPTQHGCPERPEMRNLSGSGTWSLYDVSWRVDLSFATYEDVSCKTPILLGVFVERGLFSTTIAAYPGGIDDSSKKVVFIKGASRDTH